jgi:hypothetical protein
LEEPAGTLPEAGEEDPRDTVTVTGVGVEVGAGV